MSLDSVLCAHLDICDLIVEVFEHIDEGKHAWIPVYDEKAKRDYFIVIEPTDDEEDTVVVATVDEIDSLGYANSEYIEWQYYDAEDIEELKREIY